MPLITFQPSGKTVELPRGSDLLEAARQAGVEIEFPCGGKGTCGKCIVRIISGDVDSDSLGVLSASTVSEGYMLACRTKILDTPVTVEIQEPLGREGGKFSDELEDIQLIRHELLPEDYQFDPLALKWVLDVPPPQKDDGLSDLDRLTRTLQKEWGKTPVSYTLPVLRSVADVVRRENGRVTVTLIRSPERYQVIGIEPGDRTTRHYGISVDVGTTTVAVQLVFLPMAQIVATRTAYNDQIECGLDVISRINYSQKPGHLEELRTRVLRTINRLIQQVCSSHGVAPNEICNGVVAGNTTMIHLLLGLNPEYIRLEPYTPTVLEAPYLTADQVGIAINPQSWIYIAPCVGSYVGGDITCGLLCTDLAAPGDEINLFIDVGTNGELVVGNQDFLLTCACSAGPAFEGGGIECGMRAAVGAIERVEIDAESGQARCQVIGDVKPRGICGSGMISLLADLLITGWIDAAGKLDRNRTSPAIEIDGKGSRYIIVPNEQSASGKPIALSEIDIENIIRAKAAIYSACSLMLEKIGLEFADLATIYIAGGFGRFLDIEKARIIGLVPDLPREKYRYIGNSSLMGAYMVLVSQDFKERQLDLARRMTYIDLSSEANYMNHYTGALFLPHTERSAFPTVHALIEGRPSPG
ncbi:DUF4445 domain-containing protein [candidate division KSB1 bacterium]|nr:DUF4445 domain-containing protein [candidate division KSB1 bacterium]